jgi:hypothetical protein
VIAGRSDLLSGSTSMQTALHVRIWIRPLPCSGAISSMRRPLRYRYQISILALLSFLFAASAVICPVHIVPLPAFNCHDPRCRDWIKNAAADNSRVATCSLQTVSLALLVEWECTGDNSIWLGQAQGHCSWYVLKARGSEIPEWMLMVSHLWK